MTWQKVENKDTFVRADGALVHRMVADEWAAALPGRSGIPAVIRDSRGKHIRTFAGAQAAMAFLDEEHPVKEKAHG